MAYRAAGSKSESDSESLLNQPQESVFESLCGVNEDNAELRKVSFAASVKAIFRTVGPFFCDAETRLKAFCLAMCVVVPALVGAALLGRMSVLVKDLQQSLKDTDEETFYSVLNSFGAIVPVALVAKTMSEFGSGAFSLEWRRYITSDLLSEYINMDQAYYRLKAFGADIDNPDQRIGQDVGEFTSKVVMVLTHVLQAIITVITMGFLLYRVSRKLFLFLIFGSLAFTLFSVCCFGAPLMQMQRKILEREATLRFNLVRVREHAESIAFFQGADFERNCCFKFFSKVLHICYRRLAVFTLFQGLNQVVQMSMHFLPPLIMAPEYFAGIIPFGAMGQAHMLFNTLMMASTFITAQLDQISTLGAQAVRVRQLQDTLADMKEDAPEAEAIDLRELPCVPSWQNGHPSSSDERLCLDVQGVTLYAPGSQFPIVSNLSLKLKEGQSLMIEGSSGVGKSSLLRAIGGIWATGHGLIQRCRIKDCFFAPQSPYLCVGSLRENVEYPNCTEKHSHGDDSRVEQALANMNIGYLVARHGLDTEVKWDEVLSGGEKQRLGLSRLLLRSDIRLAILDEATSALDLDNENHVYELIQARVPCFASVGHRQNLKRFHTHALNLTPRVDGQGAEGFLEVQRSSMDASPL